MMMTIMMQTLKSAISRSSRPLLLQQRQQGKLSSLCTDDISIRTVSWFSSEAAAAASSSNLDDENDGNIVNNFDVLGLPTTFNIDERQLKANYLKIMVECHPDKHRHTRKSSSLLLVEDPEARAALVTKAFDVLQKPHTRAVHLLELSGKPLYEEATTGSSHHHNNNNNHNNTELVGFDFLMEIMEFREDIAHAADSPACKVTGGECDAALQPLWAKSRERMQETCQNLAKAFEEHDLDRALEYTAQLQYWNRIDETLREKMDSLE